MRSLHKLCLLGITVALLGASSASGEGGTIELQTTVEKRIQRILANGKIETLLEPAGVVVPGDTVAYTIQARNLSADQDAERVVITDPIPEHTRYVDGSAEGDGAEILFSVDGGMRFDVAHDLYVAEADGRVRPATPQDYTHIRWVFREALAPSETRAVRFFAQLQ